MAFRDEAMNGYSAEEGVLVETAKRTHRATTESAQRALSVAEKTKELAANTLDELNRQGQTLDRVDRDLSQIDADVQESKSLISYMRRCCCCFLFSCCCDCDDDAARDATRKQRVKMRKEIRKQESELMARAEASSRAAPSNSTALKAPGEENMVRNELLGKADEVAKKHPRSKRAAAYRIGQGLNEQDKAEVDVETEAQEKALDQIDDALDAIKRMGRDMGDEISRQDEKIGRLQDRTEKTQGDLANVSNKTKKEFALKSKNMGTPTVTQAMTRMASARLAQHL
eukprot:jgi/Botrbrau1/14425/Bobra.0014s0072.1